MDKNEAQTRIRHLRALIARARSAYHARDREEMSPEALDSLKHELLRLEEKFPDLVTPDSPTQTVGGEPLEAFEKVRHNLPMLSIEDIFEERELQEWEAYLKRLLASEETNIEYFAELKVDGLAVSLIYRGGLLVRAATRGDGTTGEDVTQNIKTIESVPRRLRWTGDIEVRGEAYIAKKDFEAFNRACERRGTRTYANPRNLAAGSVRQLDPKLAAARPLRFIAYDIVQSEVSAKAGPGTHKEEHILLNDLGFQTDSTARLCPSLDEVVAYWRSAERNRESLPFQADGVVASVNDNKTFQELGTAGKSPRGIRALKFSGEQATTIIEDVRFQVGRTGAVTPVAVLRPVRVGGVVVSRATLHNKDELERLGARLGDTVIVERAGDVIPRVVRVLADLRLPGAGKAIRFPSRCPECSEILEKREGEVAWRCANRSCRTRRQQGLEHAVSRKGFDIQGLGPKIIEKLLCEGLISGFPDLFELREGDLASLEGLGETSARNLVNAISKAKAVSLDRFLVALGILHVGEETAKDLADHFGELKRIQEAGPEDLARVEGVGSVVAQSIAEWFKREKNRELIERLLAAGVKIKKREKAEESSALRGMKIVLTGTLSSISRDEAKRRIEARGGKVAESVSQGTSLLVAGAKPGSKLKKAKELGVRIVNEREFLKL